MPTNEFQCSCGNTFSIMVRKSLDATTCPQCSAQAPRKLSAPATRFADRTGNEDIDVLVGSSASDRWEHYEARKQARDKARDKFGTERLTVDPKGNIRPLDGARLEERRSIAKEYHKAYAEDRVIDKTGLS